ncbi:hypothetical protein HY030_00780 [Candidatus Gottesmanbacteria bacterium]|nr:hypothetical protein [Candidatus Gottesmanbacteria bacterium]
MLACQARLELVFWSIANCDNLSKANLFLPFLGITPPPTMRIFDRTKKVAKKFMEPKTIEWPKEGSIALLKTVSNLQNNTETFLNYQPSEKIMFLAMERAKAALRKARILKEKPDWIISLENELVEQKFAQLRNNQANYDQTLNATLTLYGNEFLQQAKREIKTSKGKKKYEEYLNKPLSPFMKKSLIKLLESDQSLQEFASVALETDQITLANLTDLDLKKLAYLKRVVIDKADAMIRNNLRKGITNEDKISLLAQKNYRQIIEKALTPAMFAILKENNMLSAAMLFSSDPLSKSEETLIPQIIDRIEKMSSVETGLTVSKWTYGDIENRQLWALRKYGIEEVLYRTPESEELADEMGDKSAGLPWKFFAEAPYFCTQETFFREFSQNLFLARQVLQQLIFPPVELIFIKEKLGLTGYQISDLQRRVKAIILNKKSQAVPDLEVLPTSLISPVVFERGDFTRVLKDGQVSYIATELEDSPGAIGISFVGFAGYEGCVSDLASKFNNFMQNVALPENTSTNRKRLTILTTREWSEYIKDAKIFAYELEKFGIKVKIVTMEDLAEQYRDARVIENGFVYNFAYLGNFYKDPMNYYLNLMQNPRQAAKLLGKNLNKILIVDEEQMTSMVRTNLETLVNNFRRDPSVSPEEILENNLLRALYITDIVGVKSTNPRYKGLTIKDIARNQAERMAKTATAIYRRQNKDLFIFNDPASGLIINGKNDLAIFTLPFFQEYYRNYLIKIYGFSSEKADQFINMLNANFAKTIPLLSLKGYATELYYDGEIQSYVDQEIEIALQNPQQWILKVVADPILGQLDWGGRGTITDVTREKIELARKSSLPFVLQKKVPNTPFTKTRINKTQQVIRDDNAQRIGIFVRDPGSIYYQ